MHYRFVSTEMGESKFGFFRYAQDLCGRCHVPHPLRSIFAMMRIHLCSFLVEERIDSDKRAEEERTLLELLRPDIKRMVYQISFFRATNELKFSTDWDAAMLPERAAADKEVFSREISSGKLTCLGFVRLYLDTDAHGNPLDAYIHEAVIQPLDIGRNYVHSKARFTTTVLDELVEVDGSYFAQQQGIVSCCSHTAVMVVLKNVFQVLQAKGISCPADVDSYENMNHLLGIDHWSRFVRNGLGEEEIHRLLGKAFADLELEVEVFRWDEAAPELTADDIIARAYFAVECGLPAVIAFSGAGVYHAMAVVGHTFESWDWAAKGNDTYFKNRLQPYKPSHSWVRELIVQDDNFGPYCALSRRDLADKHPIVIAPRFKWSLHRSPATIESFAAVYLVNQCWLNETKSLFQSVPESLRGDAKTNFWFYELLRHIVREDFVLRTTPGTKAEYWAWLRDRVGTLTPATGESSDGALEDIEGALGPTDDARLWIVEISIPEVYQHNTHRVAEMILVEIPNKGDYPIPWPCLIRLPGVLRLNNDFNSWRDFGVSARYHYDLIKRSPEDLAQLITPVFPQEPGHYER